MDGLVDTFSNRLNTAMKIRNIKATELSLKTGIAKSSLSEYINGKYEAKQDGVYLLAKALDVNEAWLMGCDVPMERKDTLSDIRMASYNGIDTEGLDENDIDEINRFVEFIKNKKKMDNK
jgi:transcriptional regulator with XRE-family HTH domain